MKHFRKFLFRKISNHVPDSLSVKLEFRIPFVSGFLDWLTCFPDSKAKDFGFYKQKNSGIRNRNPDSGFSLVGRAGCKQFY